MTFAFAAVVFLPARLVAGATAARVWEDTLSIPTYQEGLPVEEPRMAIFSPGNPDNAFYPYTARTRLLNREHLETWRAVHLENEYLACSVLPDLGGHLYRCIDKADGRDIFHPALCIKKQLIAPRGAWISTGIEFNFPVGHSLVTISPVDYHWAAGSDGSASVWVGDRDRVEDLDWRVRITLRPGSRVIEQEVTLYNPGVQRRRYYWWANAAVTKESADLRYVLPAYLVSEDGTPDHASAWPVRSTAPGTPGVDRSLSSNIHEMFGVFAYLSREPFMAVYNPASRTGLAHWAKFEDVPGKKLWDWGTVDDDWVRKNLTDNNSTYIEIQAGVLPTNSDFALLMPQEAKHFFEYWIPVRDMPMIVRATPDLVLGLERKGNSIALGLSAARLMGSARVTVTSGESTVLDEVTSLNPTAVFAKSFTAPGSSRLEIVVQDEQGKTLLRYKEGVFHAKRPDELTEQAGVQIAECANPKVCLERAELEESHGDLAMARYINEIGAQRFASDAAFQRNLGRVDVLEAHFEAAQNRFKQMTTGGRSLDPESEYNWGVALRAMGDNVGAIKHFTLALSSPIYASAARLELAMIEGSSRRWKASLEWLQPAKAEENRQTAVGEVEVAVLRLSGDPEGARRRLAAWQTIDPTDLLLRYEAVRGGRKDDALWQHLAAEPDRVLRIAEMYFRLADYEDALEVLSRQYDAVPANQREPGSVLPQGNPLIAYYRGYARQKVGQNPAADFALARKLPTRYVFASRASSLSVLEAAAKADPNDGTAHYLLGNLHLYFYFPDEAVDDYRAALAAGLREPVLYRNLSLTLGKIKGDTLGALEVLTKAETQGALTPELAKFRSVLLKPGATTVSSSVTVRHEADAQQNVSPDLVKQSPDDLAKLAFSRMGGGDFEGAGSALEAAAAVLSARQTTTASASESLRSAFYELRLQRAISTARSRNCTAVNDQLATITEADPKLPYTQPGGADLLETPRALFYIGRTYGLCANSKAALANWKRALKKVDVGSADAVFVELARVQLAAYDGKPAVPQLKQDLAEAQERLKTAAPDQKFAAQYQVGILLQALGKLSDSDDHLEQAAEGAGMVKYWATIGLRDNDLARQGVK